MNLFKPSVLSPKQIERRRRILAKGRKYFILYRGILGWGMFVFLFTTLWGWHDKHGWKAPQRGDLHFVSLGFGLVLWSIMGYFWGAFVWKMHFEGPTPNGELGPRSHEHM
jgi:hypothetical protein